MNERSECWVNEKCKRYVRARRQKIFASISTTNECKQLRWTSWSDMTWSFIFEKFLKFCPEQWVFVSKKRNKIKTNCRTVRHWFWKSEIDSIAVSDTFYVGTFDFFSHSFKAYFNNTNTCTKMDLSNFLMAILVAVMCSAGTTLENKQKQGGRGRGSMWW